MLSPRLTMALALLFVSLAPLTHERAGALVADTAVMAGPVALPSDAQEWISEDEVSGSWTGLTADGLPVVLVVEQDRAVFSIAGQEWSRGPVRRQKHTVQFATAADIWAGALDVHGQLRLSASGGLQRAVLSQAHLEEITDPNWKDDFHGAEEIMLPGPESAELKTLIYRPNGEGPFPLAVLLHGASDNPLDPMALDRVWTHRDMAEMLVNRGYLVAVPHRRGRGGSGGVYAEGIGAEGYSCESAAALAGFAHAQADVAASMAELHARADVIAETTLLIGNSRGGILALDYASRHADEIAGVISFAGGWVEQTCSDAADINDAALANAASAPQSLWIYGTGDTVFDEPHTRARFEKFLSNGGQGAFHMESVPWDGGGHQIIQMRTLWSPAVVPYIAALPRR